MSEDSEFREVTNLSHGRLLSERLKDAPREISTEARWLDQWVADPVVAIGTIFDLGDTRSQGHEGVVIYELVFGKDPIIDHHDFAIACVRWLESGSHEKYQYQTLFEIMQRGTDFLVPEVFEWYINNISVLRQIYNYPKSGYNRFMEMIEYLATGKTLKEYSDWWRSQVREARNKR